MRGREKRFQDLISKTLDFLRELFYRTAILIGNAVREIFKEPAIFAKSDVQFFKALRFSRRLPAGGLECCPSTFHSLPVGSQELLTLPKISLVVRLNRLKKLQSSQADFELRPLHRVRLSLETRLQALLTLLGPGRSDNSRKPPEEEQEQNDCGNARPISHTV